MYRLLLHHHSIMPCLSDQGWRCAANALAHQMSRQSGRCTGAQAQHGGTAMTGDSLLTGEVPGHSTRMYLAVPPTQTEHGHQNTCSRVCPGPVTPAHG